MIVNSRGLREQQRIKGTAEDSVNTEGSTEGLP
jgi:hypothetical protein